jgi:hypothetical protein
MIDVAEMIWVCENGHVDDHHHTDAGVCLVCGGAGRVTTVRPGGLPATYQCASCKGDGRETNNLCSRCGGTCEHFSLDALAREYRERLRVNVGILAENRQLKGKLHEANLRTVAEVSGAVGHHLDAASEARDMQAAIDRVDAALKLLAPFRDPADTEREGQ